MVALGNTTVCDKCSTSAAGTIECAVNTSASSPEGTFYAMVYSKQNPMFDHLSLYYEYTKSLGQKMGVSGVAYSMLIFLLIVCMFIFDPVLAVVAAIIALVFLFMLGIASLPFLAITSLVSAGIIVIIAMRT